MLSGASSSKVALHPTTSTNRARPKEAPSTSKLPKLPFRRSSTSSRPATPSSTFIQPQYGLHYPPSFLASLPTVSSPSSAAPAIRLLTAAQFVDLYRQYTKVKLPEKELFPWLHGGADVPGSNAAEYFGYGRERGARVPSYRGLTILHTHTDAAPSIASSNPTNHSTASFSTFTTSLSSSISSLSASTNSTASSTSSFPHSLLVSSISPSAILSLPPHSIMPVFKIPPPSTVVSLRDFPLQPAKYASISDIVLYHPLGFASTSSHNTNTANEELISWAQACIKAIQFERQSRQSPQVEYNVFIIKDSFDVFEKEFEDIVAVDAEGMGRNVLHFGMRDREEVRVLTEASPICEGVWLGNCDDVPYPNAISPDFSEFSDNPNSFTLCLEGRDGASLVTPSALQRLASRLSDQSLALSATSSTSHIPASEVLHLEYCPSTLCLPFSPDPTTSKIAFVDQLLLLASFLRALLHPTSPSHFPRHKALLHCLDGYTETSLLSIVYLMLTYRLTAPDAYLHLQLKAERSFFVSESDWKILRWCERAVGEMLGKEDEEMDRSEAVAAGMRRSDSGFEEVVVDGKGEKDEVKKDKETKERESERKDEKEREREKYNFSTPATHPWFYATSFDGHFPSRILPYLYLGNLNHAKNALMLKELGITHVVSMGETALVPPSPPSAPYLHRSLTTPNRRSTSSKSLISQLSSYSISSSPLSSSTIPNSLYSHHMAGSISVLDIPSFQDDGMDSITPHLETTLEFIENARRKGGVVLVHCRVGVSRSASVVIGYLMKFLQLDLKAAWLLVRSRRLNILIQPSLPFAAALHAFEAELIEQKEANHDRAEARQNEGEGVVVQKELGTSGLSRENRLTWSKLCEEIAALNARFLPG